MSLLYSFLAQGCDNNGTIVAAGTIVEDNNWWYVCNKSRWRIVGCMINGKRFSVGDTFFGHLGEFWGRCDLLGSSYIRRHLQGCVDYKGNPVKPGTAYLSDALFWSMCSGTRQLYYIPSEGTIAINVSEFRSHLRFKRCLFEQTLALFFCFRQ